MNTKFPLETLRKLFVNAIPEEQAQADEQAPELSRFYVPSTHTRALNPNNMLVEGIRGSGKSVWWAALQDERYRQLVADLLPRSELANIHCRAGFGQTKSDNYPSKQILKNLLDKYESQDIWYTIVAFNALPLNMPNTWAARIDWVKSDPERIERAFIAADKQQGLKKLILFDALDRAADDWGSLRRLLKGLLQVLLEFRSSRVIRLKAFVRPDMLEDAEVSAFPDGSKVISSKVMLDWPKIELFSLLWHHLGNEPSLGEIFRQVCQQHFGQKWTQHASTGVWLIPDKMRVYEEKQREIFHALAGPYMGSDARRGFPYTWLPNHLGDGYDQTSPRSFLAALHTAALDHLRDKQAYPLHYQSIKKGVQAASSIRVRELREDYPWIDRLMTPLNGQTVPCEFNAITHRWGQKKVLKTLQQANDEAVVRLPPSRLEQGYEGIKQDLIELGIFRLMRDGRINMPDVYRIGYGLGRKGGVKPVR
ncbi:MAG: hypothetical protein DRR19_05765 [Candidatus Parabeggiatoa sp. nov. 1]|nr:MAG: hypothetical protein DRR19_05765 [Gammaproteobacteria bacterium]